MTLEEYRKSKNGQTGIKRFKGIITKVFICGILVLSVLIICNLSDGTKALIKKELFQTNFNFSKINKVFSNLFGKKNEEEAVGFARNINYTGSNKYKDGVSLSTTQGEAVPLVESGIVVFIGEKEEYGNTIIVQQSNGVDVWYGNVENISIKLYDYVNKGANVATAKDSLYLVFQKNGEFLDYKDYIE